MTVLVSPLNRSISATFKRYYWIFLSLSALVLAVPLRYADLAGYDDALYAHIAKGIVRTGNWLDLQSNGYPALEHPPLLPWMQAAAFEVFGVSDAAARVPSIVSAFAVVLLVHWLAKRLLDDRLAALLGCSPWPAPSTS